MSDGADPYPEDPSCACSVCGQLKDVEDHDQLCATQAPVPNLLRTRQLFATQINSTSHDQDPFGRLPNELLSRVFEECGPSYGLRLGAVCYRWCRIARSTPRLWTTIDIRLVNNSESLNSTLIFARDWLNRSGQLPLTIHISIKGATTRASSRRTSGMATVIKLINEYAHCWHDLQLRIPDSLLQEFRSDPQGRSILRKLLIVCDKDQPHYAFRPQHARLCPTVVRIQHRFHLVDIEWNNVTQVEVNNFSVDECLEMFRRAPRITDCMLTCIYVDPSPAYPFPGHRIVHPNLKSFSVSVINGFGSAPLLFRHISFPSLCELRYDSLSAIEHDEEFLAFLACSSSYLHILYLEASQMQDSAVMRILQATKALTDLYLRSYTTVHNHLFQLLADSSLATADNDRNPFLPGLRCFQYRCHSILSRDFLPKIFGPLSEIGNPNRRPLSKFSLTYSPCLRGPDFEPNIDENAVLQILELQHRGMQLEVFCGEKDVLEGSLKAHRLLPAWFNGNCRLSHQLLMLTWLHGYLEAVHLSLYDLLFSTTEISALVVLQWGKHILNSSNMYPQLSRCFNF